MDTKEKSLHLLGTFGIVGEVFKIIHSQFKVLGIITLVSILPPVLITLANILLASYVRSMIYYEKSDFETGLYILKWTEFLVVEVVWITFFYMGLMPSIAAVVYTVAGVYKGEQGISVESLPAVWKRMLITCMWHFLASLVIVVGFGFVMMLSIWMPLGIPFLIGLVVFGCLGMYVTMVWHMATVVSVMEEDYYGFAGLKRSQRLIHGKRLTAWGLLMFLIVFVGLFNFAAVVGNYFSVNFWVSLLYTVGYVVFASGITLMWEVTQSVLYFVCKAHHGDSLDQGLSLEACPERPPISTAGGNLNFEINNNNMGRPNFLTS
ncbi:hypothetical protein SUGI_1197080 [Cryptomeria japonica]|uniref:uncharacterized protein LOC131079005 n=1 Tax=Cryptomeria japonica TaxID=3369 RepID=UPI002414B232|nr:uncharacterized protein LOC131079005 [Cryptomeria japonica]GLJ55734.1 hypothetical protein SUGI_1197080 [Cryptomeria japonica]